MAEEHHRSYSSDSDDDDVRSKRISKPSLSKAQLSGLPAFKRKRDAKDVENKETDKENENEDQDGKPQKQELQAEPSKTVEGTSQVDQSESNAEKEEQGESAHHQDEPSATQKKRKLPSSRRTAEERRREIEQYEQREKLAMEKARMEAGRRSNEAIVRSHYNALPEYGRERRLESPIIQLRNYNNLIKSVLIRKFGSEAESVLDIGCGKGGDLLKWSKTRIRHYIGVDIADVSIQQARERYTSMRRKPFRSDFFVGDAFHSDIKTIVPPQMFPVDVVSMMFCMHYAFETEEMARRTLENISQSLQRGGILIGTIPSSDTIIENIEKLGPEDKGWKNSIYRVEFVDTPSREGVFRPPFGHKYRFYLQDAVGDVPEYVVPFEAFRALAEDYNLSLIYRENFHAVFDEEVHPDSDLYDLCRRLNVSKSDGTFGIEGDQREAAGFYLAFAFEKLGNS